MDDRARSAGLRIVPASGERSPVRRRTPGAAVLLVLFYAALFAGGLWWYRARSPLFRVSLVAAAGTFALAGMMFFIIPRVGQATLPFRAELGRRISGFTDHVELGAYGEIETDTTVVMRVRFPDDLKDPERLPNLRWRGLVFDSFDGRVWTAGARQRLLLRREATGEFAIAAPRGTGFMNNRSADNAVFNGSLTFLFRPVPRVAPG